MSRRIADRYLLGKQLGAGGTSRVHAALDERLGRQVAIKLLDAQLVASADPAGRERFLREGPTSASFSHRNAVTVFDVGEDDGDLYIVMELIDGQSLAERLATNGPLAVEVATDIAIQVLAALAAAHGAGIVHRDVKPANVLLGTNGDVKLADFGIAKRFDDLEDSVTSTGMVIGTPRYLAPEQATGSPATPATDVYGVGILLFEMLTGHAPTQPAPDVRSLRPEVTAGLAAAVARALAAKPADRFPSASEMSAGVLDADATHVMQTAARAGDTQIMTSAIVAPPVEVVPLPPPRPTGVRKKSKAVPVMIGAAVIAVVVVIAVLSGREHTTQFTVPTTVAGAAAATETVPVAPPELVPVTTEASTTTAPLDEIIPGFPRTDDIEVFLQQLEDNPSLVGEKGEELVTKLGDVLDQHPGKKQRDAAKKLQNEMVMWVEAEQLDPAIADALDELLDTLVK